MSMQALVEEARLFAEGREIPAHVHSAADLEFLAEINRVIPEAAIERAFYSKITGVKHPNQDGSSRVQLVKSCRTFDALELRPEPQNPVDRNAVAVHLRGTGQQLGYLPAHTAHDIILDLQEDGPWLGFLRRRYRDPEHDRTVGATIFLIRLTEEFAKSKLS